MSRPFISIIIPVRNEEHFISECLDSVLANDYPSDRAEILIIDGLSTDSSLRIITEYSLKYLNISILTNSKKVFPSAVNMGISRTRGEWIFILGAHAKYNSDYFSMCVDCAIKYNADNVGGPLKTVSLEKGITAKLISIVLSNSFGVGNSKFRTGTNRVIDADTVFGGCYKKEVFSMVGMFNESLSSTSDFEFNKRLKRHGGRILLIPELEVTYFTRSTLAGFISNNLRNGYWAVFPLALTEQFPVSVRHLTPLVFVLSLIVIMILSLVWPGFLVPLFSILGLYLVTSIWFSLKTLKNNYKYLFFLPIFFFILHLTYGIGSIVGMFGVFFLKLANKKVVQDKDLLSVRKTIHLF